MAFDLFPPRVNDRCETVTRTSELGQTVSSRERWHHMKRAEGKKCTLEPRVATAVLTRHVFARSPSLSLSLSSAL